MAEYERVLLLRKDGVVEEVKRVAIKRSRYGDRSITFEDTADNVQAKTIVEALEGTAVGNSSNATRVLRELRDSNDRLTKRAESLTAQLDWQHQQVRSLTQQNETLKKQRVALEEDKAALREKVTTVQAKNDDLLALQAATEDTNMATNIIHEDGPEKAPATEPAPSLWDNIKADAMAGLKLGAGVAASQLTAEATTKLLAEIGVPQHALEHPLMKVLIQAGAPVAVRGVVGFIPGVKDNKTLNGFLASAQRASFANITQKTVDGATKFVMPMIGQLMSAASAQKELEGNTEVGDTKVTQLDNDEGA